jgi:hypothetical protein
MAKLKDGFYKQTATSIGDNTMMLLAGGGYKPLADFAEADHTHSYAGSSTAGGPATKVVCSAATSDTNRPILVTNESNGLCYTTKVKLNYSTGNITAPTFTGNLVGNADSATYATSSSTTNALNGLGANSESGATRAISSLMCLDTQQAQSAVPWGTGYNNAILSISRYSTSKYTSQLGFSATDLYVRHFNNEEVNKDKTWDKVLTSANYATYCAPESHTHNYAGSSSAGGAATSVVVGTGTSSAYRPIVVHNGNALYSAGDATGKPRYNYSTGDVKAKSFTTDGGSFNGNLIGNVTGNLTGNVTGNADTATNADMLDNLHASSFARVSTYPATSDNNWNLSGGIYSTSSGTEGLPLPNNGNHVIHCNWDMNAANQLFLAYDRDLFAFRRKQGNVWQPWKTVAFTSDIPTSLKNPNKLTLSAGTFAAKTYDGSSAVTVKIPTHTSHLTNDSGFITIDHAHSYLPLAGGTMNTDATITFQGSGGIKYKGAKGNYQMISFLSNSTDANGDGIRIGGGGTVIIGAGESSTAFISNSIVTDYNDEILHLAADGGIKFYSGCNTIANRQTMTLESGGKLLIPGGLTLSGTANSAAASIAFSRTTYNYITSPSGSNIGIQPGGLSSTSTTGYKFDASAFFPGVTNTYTIGTSSLKWKNIYATTFTGNLTGNATSADKAVCVVDYGNANSNIYIGYSGTGLTSTTCTHLAGYTASGTKIKDISAAEVKTWLGLGSAAYTNSGNYATAGHTHKGVQLSNFSSWDSATNFGMRQWATATSNRPADYGTVFDFKDPDTTWYHRLAFTTGGKIILYQGINTTTMSKIGTVSYDGHKHAAGDITSGTLAVARGGTGKTTLQDAANALINALTTGSSNPIDADYYVCQYAGGGTTTTTYHRRPHSALYNYLKGKFDSVYAPTHSHSYLPLAGGTLTGTVTCRAIATSAHNTYDIGVSGTRFKNGYFQGKVYAASGFFQSSDERLKEFFNPISVDLEKLKKLRKSYFKFKGDDTIHIGVSAQEIKELYPEVVSETEEGFLNVDYSKLSVIALRGIDKLYEMYLELKEANKKLEKQLQAKN